MSVPREGGGGYFHMYMHIGYPGRYVSLRPVHHPRKSLSERHPKRG